MAMNHFLQNKTVRCSWVRTLVHLNNTVLQNMSIVLADFVKIHARGVDKTIQHSCRMVFAALRSMDLRQKPLKC